MQHPFPSQAEEVMCVGEGGRLAPSLVSHSVPVPRAHSSHGAFPLFLRQDPVPTSLSNLTACRMGRKELSSHSVITLNNALCKPVTFSASKKGETINRAAMEIISLTVLC